MQLILFLFLQMSTSTGPIDSALDWTNAPNSLRAAFTVELVSDNAVRIFDFDPRQPDAEQWKLISARGEDGDLITTNNMSHPEFLVNFTMLQYDVKAHQRLCLLFNANQSASSLAWGVYHKRHEKHKRHKK